MPKSPEIIYISKYALYYNTIVFYDILSFHYFTILEDDFTPYFFLLILL